MASSFNVFSPSENRRAIQNREVFPNVNSRIIQGMPNTKVTINEIIMTK
jgi:hypothetical protein